MVSLAMVSWEVISHEAFLRDTIACEISSWTVVPCEVIPQDLQKAMLVSKRPGQRVLGVAAMGSNARGRYRALRHILTCVLHQ